MSKKKILIACCIATPVLLCCMATCALFSAFAFYYGKTTTYDEIEVGDYTKVDFDMYLRGEDTIEKDSLWADVNGYKTIEGDDYEGYMHYNSVDWETKADLYYTEDCLFSKIEYENSYNPEWGLTEPINPSIEDLYTLDTYPFSDNYYNYRNSVETSEFQRDELESFKAFTNPDKLLDILEDNSQESLLAKTIASDTYKVRFTSDGEENIINDFLMITEDGDFESSIEYEFVSADNIWADITINSDNQIEQIKFYFDQVEFKFDDYSYKLTGGITIDIGREGESITTPYEVEELLDQIAYDESYGEKEDQQDQTTTLSYRITDTSDETFKDVNRDLVGMGATTSYYKQDGTYELDIKVTSTRDMEKVRSYIESLDEGTIESVQYFEWSDAK